MKTTSPFLFSLLFALLLFTNSSAQNVGINTNAADPDESAMLDIVNSNKGMLIPLFH